MSKLISTFKIGLDDETKAEIAALKSSLDAVSNGLKAGTFIPTGGLLAAMVCEAANDASEPELLQMGQWIFEGRDKKWASAHVDQDGQGFLCTVPKSMTIRVDGYWTTKHINWRVRILDGKFDASDWENSAIDRETVNDVDYLSETTPEMQGMDAGDIIIDEVGRNYSSNSNCLHAVVPQITQADMQLIFIKNLSDVLIQRMRSMDRFSEDDDVIGVAEFMPWDIVFDRGVKAFGVITNTHTDSTISAVFFPKRECGLGNNNFHIASLKGKVTRTITEAQLTEFRVALEACYA